MNSHTLTISTICCLVMALCRTVASDSATGCAKLVCGKTVEGRCFTLKLHRKRCRACKEDFFGIALPPDVHRQRFQIAASISPHKKYKDTLHVEDVTTGEEIGRFGEKLQNGSILFPDFTRNVRLSLKSEYWTPTRWCIPPDIYQRDRKHRRGYNLVLTLKPKRCPALDLDMGCGRYLQLPEESEQGTEVNVACGCGNQRSAVGPKLTCLPTGEWNVDTSVALCRNAPHPVRLVVIADVLGQPAKARDGLLSAVEDMVTFFRHEDNSNASEVVMDRVGLVHYTRGRPAVFDSLTSNGVSQTLQLARQNIGSARRTVTALRFAWQLLRSWREDDANLTGPSAVYKLLVVSHLKGTQHRVHREDAEEVNRIMKGITGELEADVHLLEFGYVRNMDNLFRRLVGEPRQFYEIRIPRGRPKEEKTSAVVQTLNRLNPACIRLRCNQIKQGECGYVSEARQACWSKERCGGLGFLQTSGYSVATQLFSRRLPYIRDQFIVRDGHDEKERFKVFRCSAGGCNNNLDVPFDLYSGLASDSGLPFVRGLKTGWTGPEVWVEMKPDNSNEPCLSEQRFQTIDHRLEALLTVPTCRSLSAWDVGVGNLSLPDVPVLGSKVVVECEPGFTVLPNGRAVRECLPGWKESDPPRWESIQEAPKCRPFPNDSYPCPSPELPQFFHVKHTGGSEGFVKGNYPLSCDPGHAMMCSGRRCKNRIIECQEDGTWVYAEWDKVYCQDSDPARLPGIVRRRFDLIKLDPRKNKTVCNVDMRGNFNRQFNPDSTSASSSPVAGTTEATVTLTTAEAPWVSSASQEPTANVTTPTSTQRQWSDKCGPRGRVVQHVDVCMELAFLIDVSGSMGEEDVEAALNFTRHLISFFAIRVSDDYLNGARVALMTFSREPTVLLSLQRGTNMSLIFDTINRTQKIDGETNLRRALEIFRDVVAVDARTRCRQRLLFIITDGDVNTGGDDKAMRSVANQLKIDDVRARWDIYGIGVKNNAFKRSILEEVVTVPTSEYLFIMNDHQFRSVMKGIVRLKDVDYTICGEDNALDFRTDKPPHHQGEVRTAQYPWVVFISVKKNGVFTHRCGGALIQHAKRNDRKVFVLTAAHCVADVADQKNDIQVRLGETIVSVGEGTEDDYNLKQTYIMVEGYNPLFGHEFDYDVALLELNTTGKLELGPAVRTICLPEDDEDWESQMEEGSKVVACGWGPVRLPNGDITQSSDNLKAINLQVASQQKCKDILDATKNMFCAHDPVHFKDTCQGDSGGPLMKRRKDGNWFVVGIVSYGLGEESCAPRGQGIGAYTKLTGRILQWVKEKLHNFVNG